jgi:hypothetical protein
VTSPEKQSGIKIMEKCRSTKSSDFFTPSNEKPKSSIRVNYDTQNKNDFSLTKTPSLKTFQTKYEKKDLISHHSKKLPERKEINLYVP